MTAAASLRSRCCDWHASTHGSEEHVACVVCDAPMPLTTINFVGTPEPICPRCTIALRVQLSRLGARPEPLSNAAR